MVWIYSRLEKSKPRTNRAFSYTFFVHCSAFFFNLDLFAAGKIIAEDESCFQLYVFCTLFPVFIFKDAIVTCPPPHPAFKIIL